MLAVQVAFAKMNEIELNRRYLQDKTKTTQVAVYSADRPEGTRRENASLNHGLQ